MSEQQTTPPPRGSAHMHSDAWWRAAIMHDTPAEVWREYERDGIPLRQAVKMEMSYAG
jgi:hypothetical protein